MLRQSSLFYKEKTKRSLSEEHTYYLVCTFFSFSITYKITMQTYLPLPPTKNTLLCFLEKLKSMPSQISSTKPTSGRDVSQCWLFLAPTVQGKQLWLRWKQWPRSSTRGGPPSCCPAPPPQASGTTSNTRAWHLSPAPAHASPHVRMNLKGQKPGCDSGRIGRMKILVFRCWEGKSHCSHPLLSSFSSTQCSPGSVST